VVIVIIKYLLLGKNKEKENNCLVFLKTFPSFSFNDLLHNIFKVNQWHKLNIKWEKEEFKGKSNKKREGLFN